MKKLVIPLAAVAVVASIMFASCAPGAAPAPEEAEVVEEITLPSGGVMKITQDANGKEWADGGYWQLQINPYEGLAIKPDGTPFHFAAMWIFMGNDWSINENNAGESILLRSGAQVDNFDSNVDMDRQIQIIDNLLATSPPDAMIVHSVNDELIVPSIDKAWEAGIPSFCIDFGANTDNLVTFVEHWQDGPSGSNVLGKLFVDIAERENKEIFIYEVRSNDAVASFRARYAGFHSAVDQCPLITVTLSPECYYDEEKAASFVMDAFTAHPELNGLYVQGGGAAGSIEGLRAIGRLVQPDDPNHVLVFTNDCDKIVVKAMDDGFVTAVGTHFSYDLVDVVIKQLFTYVILGQPVSSHVWVPMKAVTPDTIDTAEGLILGAPIGPRMPTEQWDYWPVLDTSEGVFDIAGNPVPLPTPTVELREQYQGY